MAWPLATSIIPKTSSVSFFLFSLSGTLWNAHNGKQLFKTTRSQRTDNVSRLCSAQVASRACHLGSDSLLNLLTSPATCVHKPAGDWNHQHAFKNILIYGSRSCFRLKKTVMLHIIKFFETGGVSNAKVMGSIPMDI